jgi:hypothetical protein
VNAKRSTARPQRATLLQRSASKAIATAVGQRRDAPGPGTRLDPVTLKLEQLAPVVAAAARKALGVSEAARGTQVVWAEGADELLVDAGGVSLETDDGLVQIIVPVFCDQIGEEKIRVTFAVGSPDRPAGMIVAAGRVPEGPLVIVSRWGDSLVALAWSVLVGAVNAVAGAIAVDQSGSPLISGEIVAQRGVLTIVPFARHRFGTEAP